MELTYRIVGHLILFCYFLRSSQAIRPVFTAYTPSPIKEGLPPGSFYYQFVASHAVSYSFEAKASEWFNINSSGYATVNKTIDREVMGNAFTYQVEASDGSLTDVKEVRQQIIDINDIPPKFTNLPRTINISEDLAVGGLVYQLSADDADEAPANYILFNIKSGNEEGRFEITDGYNGKITLKKLLDFDEGTKRFELGIIAENADTTPKLNASSILTINVLNVDDLGAKFEKGLYEATIVKDSLVGTVVTTVQANDGDGLNATVEYKIYQETNIGAMYKINNNTGEITVNGPLTLGITVLVVTATSTVHSPVFTVVKVTVASMINMSFTVSVPEGQSNVVIFNLEPAEQFYNITGGTFSIIPGGQSGLFNIDGKNLKVGPQPLDRETKDQYQLSIALEKDGLTKGLVLINIKVQDINDNPPIFQGSLPYNVMVREDIGTGESIFRVTATDIDGGHNGTVKYAVTAGNEQGSFSIDNITGVISISKTLDRETTAEYTLTVQAYDGGTPPMSNVTTVLINVTDVNDNSPVFKSTIINAAVLENAVNGALVIQVTANDKDIGENSKITYHILEGSYGKFIINQTSGVITTAGDLSFKEMSKYTVIVRARDNGLSPRTASALVYITITSAGVNQYAPVFTKPVYLGGVYKDTSDEKVVLTVKATDADSGTNGEVTYELTENPAQTFFHLESVSGQLRTANSFFEKEGKLYILKAQAKDKGSNPKVSNTAELCVFVLRQSYSMELSAGVNQDFILKNFEEFKGVLDALTGGKAFIKSVRPQKDDSRASTIIFNTVKNKTELTTAEVKSLLDSKKDDITNNYSKWKLGAYDSPQVGSLKASAGGLSAVVGAMICLALLIGVGGIIMIIILIKKRREREIARKDTRVRFSDKLSYINIDGSLPVSKLKHVDSAQEAHEGTSNVSDETSSIGSEEVQTAPDVMNYINQAYHDDDNDGHLQEDGFVTDHDRVNFGTFFPPPPTEPPPPVPDSDAGDSIASEEESINSDDEPDYINAVLPPHEDFADADHVNSQDIPSSNGDSPTTDSRTDSTSQLISPVSYKDSLLHDTTFGFKPLRRSSNPEQTTEL